MELSESIKYGVVFKSGPRGNKIDCESDIVLCHLPTWTLKRFHGTYWDSDWQPTIDAWITSHPKVKNVDSMLMAKFFDSDWFSNLEPDKVG